MANFKSPATDINASAQVVFDRLSDLNNLKELMAKVPEDKIPADQRDMFNAVRIDADSITFPAGPVGDIKLQMAEKISPSLIKLIGVGTPVDLSLSLELNPTDEDRTTGTVNVDIAIPAMLKPMVAGPLNNLVSQFAQLLPAVAGNKE